ncbi:hypothetical protein [Methylocystis sp.]|uniref:hypothetical protein n=1 Tax=Methylocystis sp. TaxID=1911079 RepID=UPI0025CF786D|nr:hypothetical protein [Methylocystis sp.]
MLLVLGTAIFVLGLLVAAHPPFQYWWYRFNEIDKKKIVAQNSEEYKNIAFHIKISGSGAALIGGLLTIDALGELGGDRLVLVAGILFVTGLLLVGLLKLWSKLTSKK